MKNFEPIAACPPEDSPASQSKDRIFKYMCGFRKGGFFGGPIETNLANGWHMILAYNVHTLGLGNGP